MAKKFLTPIDLNQNELQNAVLQPLATAPSNGVLGQIYYSSTDNKLYQHNGSNWICVGITYEVELGSLSSNTVPLKLVGSDGSESTVNVKGAGGATLSVSGNTLTITTSNTNTTYTFSGAASATDYTVTITPSSGTAQTFTVPLSDGTNAGLMSPAQHTKLAGIATGANKTTVDSSMSSSSTNPVQNKVVKAYVDDAIANLPADQFLDMNNTKFVESFAWSSATYPNSTNPSLEGKPVLVLALTDGTTTTYSFVSLNDLVDVYTGTSPINVSGGKISHAASGATAGSYGDSAVQTPAFGDTFKVPYVTVDVNGHITGISAHNVTIPYATASESVAGLMSADHVLLLEELDSLSSTVTQTYTDILEAGQTSLAVGALVSTTNINFNAYDDNTGEEVIVDCAGNGKGVYEFSIAKVCENDIRIVYNYQTTANN